jgi:hypothetical protein
MLLTRRTVSNADYQTDSNVRKAIQHVLCNVYYRRYSVLSTEQDGNDDIMFSDSA